MALTYNLTQTGELQRNIIKQIMEAKNWSRDFQQYQSTCAPYMSNPIPREPVAEEITNFIKEEFRKLDIKNE
jgi:hypothetical protein